MNDKHRYIKIQDEPNFVRDRFTGALINTNVNEINKHKRILEQKKKEKQELEQLKNDVTEIKQLLQQLLSK